MEIPKDLKDEIWDFCRVNNITNIEKYMVGLLKSGFLMDKWGAPNLPKEKIEVQIEEEEVKVENLNKEKPKVNNKNNKDLYGE